MINKSPLSPLWPADNPAVIAHLTMLQGSITRLANNSASCKTWCLTLLSALFALAGAAHSPPLLSLAIIPIVVFGYLDAMYLAQERAYRKLYASVRQSVQQGIYKIDHAYEMTAPIAPLALLTSLRSWSVYPIYVGLLLTYTLAASQGWFTLITDHHTG